MEQVNLYNKRSQAVKLALIALVFITLSLWMLSKGVLGFNNIWTWLVIGFFGLGVIIGLFQLLDRRPQL